jgi:dihydrofolate reductase
LERPGIRTHSQSSPDETDQSIRFLSGDIRSAAAKARDAPSGKDVMVIGADVARQCIQERLIDEIRVYLTPVLPGDGVRFFSWPGAPHAVRLQTIDVERSGHLTDLRFRVVK